MANSPRLPRLAVIIVTYNSSREILTCLQSLAASPPATSHAVVIVDNQSTDGTPALVRKHCPDVDVIEPGQNLGFGAANNLGMRETASELLLFLNPDTRIDGVAIDRLVATLDTRGDAAVCGPRLVDAAGRAELSFGASLSPWSELRQKCLVLGHAGGWPVLSAYVERISRRPSEPDWVSGACLLVRRSDAEAVGGFDDRYFLYAEDVDFCAAIRARGRSVLFVPSAEVVHLRGRSRRSAAAPAELAYRASQLAFYRKHRPAWAPLLSAYLYLRKRRP